jgi:hypothetical protein
MNGQTLSEKTGDRTIFAGFEGFCNLWLFLAVNDARVPIMMREIVTI